ISYYVMILPSPTRLSSDLAFEHIAFHIVCRQEDYSSIRVAFLNIPTKIKPIAVRQVNVKDNQIILLFSAKPFGNAFRQGSIDFITSGRQVIAKGIIQKAVIFNH